MICHVCLYFRFLPLPSESPSATYIGIQHQPTQPTLIPLYQDVYNLEGIHVVRRSKGGRKENKLTVFFPLVLDKPAISTTLHHLRKSPPAIHQCIHQ